ncbi:MAG: hypothetical protein MJE66_19930 [Proteobacteria bacterium]|nr:hypothetical protein [Pseudomonadota bacterium]
MDSPPPVSSPRRRAAPFRPRFTLGLLYLAGFTLLFALVAIAPELVALARPAAETDVELERQAAEAGRQAAQGRLLPALLAAVLAVLAGSHWGWLPGLREDRPRV